MLERSKGPFLSPDIFTPPGTFVISDMEVSIRDAAVMKVSLPREKVVSTLLGNPRIITVDVGEGDIWHLQLNSTEDVHAVLSALSN